MCLLIASKRDSFVDKQKLSNAFDSNRDGVGYAFSTGEKIIVKKFRKFKKFFKQYETDFSKYKETDFLIHFRLSTHGTSKGLTNVHPFKVNDGMVFAHNGVITNAPQDDILSDTQVFNNFILKNLPTDFLSYKHYRHLIEGYIDSSKLAFLRVDGTISIINEHLGHWKGGTWFSNSSYQNKVGSWYCDTPISSKYSGITDYYSKSDTKFTFDKKSSNKEDFDVFDNFENISTFRKIEKTETPLELSCDICHQKGLDRVYDVDNEDEYFSCEDCLSYFE